MSMSFPRCRCRCPPRRIALRGESQDSCDGRAAGLVFSRPARGTKGPEKPSPQRRASPAPVAPQRCFMTGFPHESLDCYQLAKGRRPMGRIRSVSRPARGPGRSGAAGRAVRRAQHRGGDGPPRRRPTPPPEDCLGVRRGNLFRVGSGGPPRRRRPPGRTPPSRGDAPSVGRLAHQPRRASARRFAEAHALDGDARNRARSASTVAAPFGLGRFTARPRSIENSLL